MVDSKINLLIEDYERRIKTITEELNSKKHSFSSEKCKRLYTKRGCYNTIVAELKSALNSYEEIVKTSQKFEGGLASKLGEEKIIKDTCKMLINSLSLDHLKKIFSINLTGGFIKEVENSDYIQVNVNSKI